MKKFVMICVNKYSCMASMFFMVGARDVEDAEKNFAEKHPYLKRIGVDTLTSEKLKVLHATQAELEAQIQATRKFTSARSFLTRQI